MGVSTHLTSHYIAVGWTCTALKAIGGQRTSLLRFMSGADRIRSARTATHPAGSTTT